MEIKLKAIPPQKPAPVYRANVHRTGKIGLMIDTAKQFGFTTEKSIELFINEADPNDTSIYGVMRNAGHENGYKILKGGDYHSIYAKSFFDTLNIDYASNSNLGYAVTEIDIADEKVLKFTKIEKEKQGVPVITGMNVT